MKERIVWLMVIAICLSGYAPTANAEITVGESNYEDWRGGSSHTMTGFSWTPGSSSVLVVMVYGGFNVGANWVTDVTFGAEAFPGGNVIYPVDLQGGGSADDSYADIWYLVNPAVTSGDITITMNKDIGVEGSGLGVVILHGVDQTTSFTASEVTGSKGGDDFSEVTISPVAGGILIDSFWQNFNREPVPVSSGSTLIYRDGSMPEGGTAAAAYRQITAGGETTERWELFHDGEPDSRRHVLTVAAFAPDPNVNPAPVVDAGPDQIILLPINKVILAGSATDQGPSNPDAEGYPGGVTSLYWEKVSGPGTVIFDPNATIFDPNATFSAPGIYELMLQVSDGFKDANDTMTVIVTQPSLVGHWPFDNSAVDASVNSNDGTLAELEQGYPQYTTDAAIGTHSISLADPNSTDPNRPHVALGAATELDFGIADWTVSAWIKTTRSSPMVIFGNGADHDGGTRYGLYSGSGPDGIVDILVDDNVNKHNARADFRVDDGQWHFILGKRDGNKIRIYRNGIHEGSTTLDANYDLSGTSAWDSYIGIITDARGGLEKQFRGLIDDVRVYNYALSDPNILQLAGMYMVPATVNLGSNKTFRLRPNELYSTVATVTDNGTPTGTHTYQWECVGRPDAGSADANAIFTSETAMNTTVELPYFGQYTLRLTVTDTAPSTSVYDDIVLTLLSSTCADVAPGNILVGDISGPGGAAVPDCYMDFYDIVKFAEDFMRCVDPENVECEFRPLVPLP